MFTGIIESIGRVTKITKKKGSVMVSYAADFATELNVDDSVSINGVCQTVVGVDDHIFSTVLVEETLRKTNFNDLKKGDLVNLERSVTLGTRLDGHLVQGHTDTTGIIETLTQEGTNWLVTISFPDEFAALVVGRGSIAIDGISLTVARLNKNSMTVAIIPYTWDHTNFHKRKPGDSVNLEFDIIGKYILRYMTVTHEGKGRD